MKKIIVKKLKMLCFLITFSRFEKGQDDIENSSKKITTVKEV